uniref:myomesin-3-like n=1 Tax=Monopterus albus TaxID=43700 RepID=UPI0009B39FBC|nr:myomesin-3-like [Monopterus albus]
METRTVMQREQEEQSSQMSQSIQLSSQKKKTTFTSRLCFIPHPTLPGHHSDEEASYSDFYPIIPADLMSVKEILNMDNFPRHRTWEILKETLAADEEEFHRDKWTLFGNEAEKLELDVIRNQHVLRTRIDKMALRKQAQEKASSYIKYLELLSQKAPDFPIPLRAHTVWEGMTVKLSCTICGSPPPKVTWYKDGVPMRMSDQPWNYTLEQKFGLNSLEIRRCSPDDAGEYKVVAKSPLGEAMTFATLVVNSYQGALAGSEYSRTRALQAQFGTSFPPTWVKEGSSLTLQCTFTSALLPFQQDVSWFRDGIQLLQSSTVDIKTADNQASITLKVAHKEHEGVYTAQLKTLDGIQEHSAFVYVTGEAKHKVPAFKFLPLFIHFINT